MKSRKNSIKLIKDLTLSSFTLTDKGYVLNKQNFTDMINIKYGWHLHRLRKNCTCGKMEKFSPNAGKYGPEKTSYLDTFQEVQGRGTTADMLKMSCNDVKSNHHFFWFQLEVYQK